MRAHAALHAHTHQVVYNTHLRMGVPAGVVTVHGARQLSLSRVPLLGRLEGDVGGGVVHDCEGAHPEMVPQPGHEPVFKHAPNSRLEGERGEGDEAKGCNRCQADDDLRVCRGGKDGRWRKGMDAEVEVCRVPTVQLDDIEHGPSKDQDTGFECKQYA